MPKPNTESTLELDDDQRTRCEVWTRVMGYHRPVSAWNPGKRSEHAERRYFLETSAGDPDHGSRPEGSLLPCRRETP
jgi:hypothetical protein